MNRLKEIDWTKNITYMVIYFIVVISFFMIFTVPSLQQTKANNIEYRKAVISNEGAKRELEKIEKSIVEFKTKNSKILNSFQTPFDKEAIKSGLEKSIDSVVINDISESTQDRYRVFTLSIEGIIDSPSDFYKTLEGLNSSKFIAKVTFPIVFDKLDNRIKISFTLKVYRLDN